MPKYAATPKDVLTKPMTVHELRSHLLALKKTRRTQIAALPILEKFRIMERMKEAADPIRAYRQRKSTAVHGTHALTSAAAQVTADSRRRD
jgi:hypothetical protein